MKTKNDEEERKRKTHCNKQEKFKEKEHVRKTFFLDMIFIQHAFGDTLKLA